MNSDNMEFKDGQRVHDEFWLECVWKEMEFGTYWKTECGEAFTFISGSPSDNKMLFCPYCGRIIKESA